MLAVHDLVVVARNDSLVDAEEVVVDAFAPVSLDGPAPFRRQLQPFFAAPRVTVGIIVFSDVNTYSGFSHVLETCLCT